MKSYYNNVYINSLVSVVGQHHLVDKYCTCTVDGNGIKVLEPDRHTVILYIAGILQYRHQ